jgi:hypothetical protein
VFSLSKSVFLVSLKNSVEEDVSGHRVLLHVFPKELRNYETCRSRCPEAGPISDIANNVW